MVFSQAAIEDFNFGGIITVDDDGTPHQHVYARTLGMSTRDAAVTLPFDHMTDMGAGDLGRLAGILVGAWAIKPALLESVVHSLTRAEGLDPTDSMSRA